MEKARLINMKTKKATENKPVTKKTAEKTAKCACRGKKPAAKKVIAKKSVKFTLHAEKGKKVFLAGQFNDWNPAQKKMTYNAKGGYYAVDLKLAEGTYEYKFVIDGIWCADPANADSVQNDKGTFNSIVVVK
jgi:1,4-alpha-glucan branching enzyme